MNTPRNYQKPLTIILTALALSSCERPPDANTDRMTETPKSPFAMTGATRLETPSLFPTVYATSFRDNDSGEEHIVVTTSSHQGVAIVPRAKARAERQ
jgi:hypothetical protein